MANPSEVTASKAPRRLRSDAARNHQAVLAAARALYAESGLGVGFEEIAREAGVGVGTVYRRFPDRESLLDALFADRLASVTALAEQALEAADAWLGLEHFIVDSVRMFTEDRGLREIAFDPTEPYPGVIGQRRRLAELLGQVTDRAHRAGVLRTDCRAQDVATIIAMLAHAAALATSGAAWASEASAARCTDFVVAGLRPSP
ncbi:TetR/AcrR family transcriptional regulator [uncultured Friedmanniella sp.]|uniref:TetR/AcrR family transcriptional regulator n=1 Tax=uncultured Friedmanniella sp. TaxID=335381 RepID=UPI0035CB1D4D